MCNKRFKTNVANFPGVSPLPRYTGPMNRFAPLFLFLVLGGVSAAVAADRPWRPEPRARTVQPVNVPVNHVVVSGTVTVRVRGVLVNPQQVTYMFQPEFPSSRGHLWKRADGTYVLRVPRVPADRPHILTISAAYNDTVLKDEVVERLGQTYTGSIRIEIPHGRDHAFGDQLLDLR